MNLDEVDPSWLTALSGIRFQNRWHSTLEPTGGFEDRKAQIWLRWMDNSFRAQSGRWAPPVWLYNRFKWGPHSWPVRWRDLPHMRVTDCGLMAALSIAVYQWRGQVAAPVQLLLYFTPESTSGWAGLWRRAGLGAHWCSPRFAYHEGCGLLGADGQLRIWDPLGRFWLPLREFAHYEGIVAFRVCQADLADLLPLVAQQRIRTGVWYVIRDVVADLQSCEAQWSRIPSSNLADDHR